MTKDCPVNEDPWMTAEEKNRLTEIWRTQFFYKLKLHRSRAMEKEARSILRAATFRHIESSLRDYVDEKLAQLDAEMQT